MPNREVDLDYSFLKKQGILYIQQLAGKIWTDYGEHDPGITILENLCFAIIDLEYRTNFLIEDILAPNPDSMALEEVQQFYYAEEILPCNPLTINDFLKVILDVPGVQNANILLSDGVQEIKGGYKIFLDIEERASKNHQEEKIKKEVLYRLCQHRNLCEDFFSIDLMKLCSVRIKASFTVNTCLSYEEGEMLLAKIFFNIQSCLSPPIHFYSLSQMIDKGKTVDQIFTGPLLNNGFVDEAELDLTKRTQIYTTDLLEQVTALAPIKNVLKFEVLLENETSSKRIVIPIPAYSTLKLDIKQSDIALCYNGISILTDQEKVMNFFDKLCRENVNTTYVGQESIFVPEGDFKELDYYASIQQDFPLIYNVGFEGFASSTATEHKAKVNQLKGFLMFFDQIFANYFSRLDNIRNIMAVQGGRWSTLHEKWSQEVPYLEKLINNIFSFGLRSNIDHLEFQVQKKYLNVVKDTKKKHVIQNDREYYINYLNKILATSEWNAQKQSDMLDHLLARFAEVFTTYSVALYEKKETEKLKDSNRDKSFFLQNYVEISRDRNKGMDLRSREKEEDSWNQSTISGFERRIYLKLGIRQLRHRFLHETLKKHVYLENNPVKSSFELFLGKGVEEEDDNIITFYGKFPQIRNLAIKYGIHEYNYDIINNPDGHYNIILYVDQARKHAIHIINSKRKPFVHIEQTEHIIRQSVHFFNTLNMYSEGFYCIEHILLRDNTLLQGNNDPYSFTMTMVFPSWPSRFQENSFRNAVQELVVSESPAHIYVNILWLDLEEIEGFEKAYQDWILLRTATTINQDKLNQAAKALLGLIMLYSRD